MLNVFTSFAAVNEAVSGMRDVEDMTGSIAEYNFEGLSLVEAIQECRNQIMAEAVSCDEFAIGANELIAEAAMSNPDVVETLTESALDGVMGKLRSLLEKLISMVKSMIVKVKTWFAKFFGRTDAWVKLMDPKVKAAKPDPELEIKMWNWQTDEISKIHDGAVKVYDSWKTNWSVKTFTTLKSRAEDIYNKHKNDENNDYDPAKDFAAVVGNKSVDDLKDDMTKAMNDAFGTSASSVDEAKSQIIKRIHGDTDSPDVIRVADKMNPMFDFVRQSKKTADGIQKLYQENLTELNNFYNSLQKTKSVTEDSDATNKGMASSVVSAFTTAVNTVSKYTTAYHSLINSLQQLQVRMIQDVAKDYMNAVTKCVNSKAKTKK